MSKARASKSAKPQAEVAPLINPEIYTQVAFALTLAIVVARAIMIESVRGSVDAVVGGSGAPRAPGPATSLFLDALCALPAILILVRRIFDRRYVIRWLWSCFFVALLAVWTLCSVAWSTDKFLTLINASNTVGSALLIWSTAQLVRSWVRLRLIGGVCAGLLLFYIAHGLTYRLLDVPDNIKYWQENKARILEEHGWEPDSFSAKQFEKKLLEGEMIGFNTSPNSFAAVIVMLMIVSAGVIIARCSRDDWIAWLIVAAIVAPLAGYVLYFTGTKTAIGTLILSACAFALLASSEMRSLLATRSKQIFWIGMIVFFLGVAAVAGHGIVHGSLPSDSLNFRWWYWTAAAKLFKQHPILGVGWGNFGEPYLSVRLPVASEEVRDPHNFLVRTFAELGLVGGLLALAWLMRSAWEITRPVTPELSTASGKRTGLLFAIADVVIGVVLNAALSIDFTQPSAYVILESFRRLLAIGLLTLAVLGASISRGGADTIETKPAPWLLYALIVGLGAFFVHNLVDFVLAEPGPLILFSVLLGAAIGVRTNWSFVQNPGAKKMIVGAAICAAIAWFVFIGAIVIPIADADGRTDDGDDQVRAAHPDVGARLLTDASHMVPYNVDYAFRAARAMALAGQGTEPIKAMLEQAIAVDPRFVPPYLMLATMEMHQPSPNAQAVRRDYEQALAIDPQNVSVRLDFAEALVKFGDRAKATEQFKKALATNAAYHVDEPKRLTPQRVEEIEKKIKDLGG